MLWVSLGDVVPRHEHDELNELEAFALKEAWGAGAPPVSRACNRDIHVCRYRL